MSVALDLLLLLTGCAHVFIAPYTKVEESFNLHAIHDVLMYGVGKEGLSKYDHFVFPGAVPRTFVGSVVIAWLTKLLIPLANFLHLLHTKFDIQVLARLVLVFYNVVGFALLRRAVGRRFGRTASVLFVLLTCSQFHLPFWMGRTLPNMFALLPVNIALYCLYGREPTTLRPSKGRIHAAIALLTFTTVVFRGELLLFLGPLVLQSLLSGYTTIPNVIRVGVLSGLASAALTVVVDSYFWQKPRLWPELYGIYFNVIEGKSSEWGVSPFHEYFTRHLPKLLLSSSVLVIPGAIIDHRVRSLLWPSVLFVAFMSCLGHKEWRFVVYVVPVFNMAAARSAAWLTQFRKGRLAGRVAYLAVVALVLANCCFMVLSTAMSARNYPGGKALSQFNEMYSGRDKVHVHLSNLAAQTGASLFLQTHSLPYIAGLAPEGSSNWWYHKTENLTPEQLTAAPHLTHLIVEIPNNSAQDALNAANGTQDALNSTGFSYQNWRLESIISAHGGVRLDTSLSTVSKEPWRIIQLLEREQLAILERIGALRL